MNKDLGYFSKIKVKTLNRYPIIISCLCSIASVSRVAVLSKVSYSQITAFWAHAPLILHPKVPVPDPLPLEKSWIRVLKSLHVPQSTGTNAMSQLFLEQAKPTYPQNNSVLA